MSTLPLSLEQQTALVERLKAGDPDAEHELVLLFRRRVQVMLEIRIRDREAARDLTQETLFAAIAALRDARLREPDRLAAFVYGIARNVANNYVRRRQGEPIAAPLEHAMLVADAEQEMLDRARRALAARALESLSKDDRAVLTLTLVEGLKPGEIAARLRLGVDVVRTRKSRALKRITAEIERLSRTGADSH
jgi:RNA polymerase sigma-70 factor (ECF subfamily)